MRYRGHDENLGASCLSGGRFRAAFDELERIARLVAARTAERRTRTERD